MKYNNILEFNILFYIENEYYLIIYFPKKNVHILNETRHMILER
jgi:hypothetical protein